MSNTFSNKNDDGKMERWFLRLILSEKDQPLPNVVDIGTNTLTIQYCLYNKDEFHEKIPDSIIIDNVPSLEKNTIEFPFEGGWSWTVTGGDTKLPDTMISMEEFQNAYCLIVWADPVGSAAFWDAGQKCWKGVLRIIDILSFSVPDEKEGDNINHIIEVRLNIAQGVISYFIDLVQTYSSNHYKELKEIHDGIADNKMNFLGRLGVMGPSLGSNDTCFEAGGIDNYESLRSNKFHADLYDYQYYEEQREKVFGQDGNCIEILPVIPYSSYNNGSGGVYHTKYYSNKVEWNQSGSTISIYDFKTPIKKLYAEMIRIGNDGRIYSNEGFSNINWGIIGRQLELEKGDMNYIAALDPFSSNEPHDVLATDVGFEIADVIVDNNGGFPAKLDRHSLFLLVLKALRENDYFTYLGAECAKSFGKIRYAEICGKIKNKSEQERISDLMNWKAKSLGK